jgi:DNA-binding response OmpR family regulator
MSNRSIAVAYDLDAASLISLREALSGWEIEVVNGATIRSLTRDWNPGTADLLVVTARDQVAETLGLCRGLRSQAGRAHTSLLVLVSSGQEAVVRAVLEAGADSCLVLPVHAKQVVSMLARVRQGNRPGRHTLNLDRAQAEDLWRDDGGQG